MPTSAPRAREPRAACRRGCRRGTRTCRRRRTRRRGRDDHRAPDRLRDEQSDHGDGSERPQDETRPAERKRCGPADHRAQPDPAERAVPQRTLRLAERRLERAALHEHRPEQPDHERGAPEDRVARSVAARADADHGEQEDRRQLLEDRCRRVAAAERVVRGDPDAEEHLDEAQADRDDEEGLQLRERVEHLQRAQERRKRLDGQREVAGEQDADHHRAGPADHHQVHEPLHARRHVQLRLDQPRAGDEHRAVADVADADREEEQEERREQRRRIESRGSRDGRRGR